MPVQISACCKYFLQLSFRPFHFSVYYYIKPYHSSILFCSKSLNVQAVTEIYGISCITRAETVAQMTCLTASQGIFQRISFSKIYTPLYRMYTTLNFTNDFAFESVSQVRLFLTACVLPPAKSTFYPAIFYCLSGPQS